MMKLDEYLRDADRLAREDDIINENANIERVVNLIAKAKLGDFVAGRELLRIVANRIKKDVEFGFELKEYISEILLNISQQESVEAGRILNIYEKKAANRPKNLQRIEYMRAAYDQTLELTTFDSSELKIIISEHQRIQEIPDSVERDAQFKDLMFEIGDARLPLTKDEKSNEPSERHIIATILFNSALRCAQEKGERLDERPIKPSALRTAIHRSS